VSENLFTLVDYNAVFSTLTATLGSAMKESTP